jgi:programmed cell death protein 5
MVTEDEIKKRLLRERMKTYGHAVQEQQVHTAVRNIMAKILDKKARERLSNLKIVKPELAMQLELYLAQLYSTGQVKRKITDAQIVQILSRLTKKKEIRIRRK